MLILLPSTSPPIFLLPDCYSGCCHRLFCSKAGCCQHHCLFPNPVAVTPALLVFLLSNSATFCLVINMAACCAVLLWLALHCAVNNAALVVAVALGCLHHDHCTFSLEVSPDMGLLWRLLLLLAGGKSCRLHCHHRCPAMLLPIAPYFANAVCSAKQQSKVCWFICHHKYFATRYLYYSHYLYGKVVPHQV